MECYGNVMCLIERHLYLSNINPQQLICAGVQLHNIFHPITLCLDHRVYIFLFWAVRNGSSDSCLTLMSFDMKTISTGDLQGPVLQFLLFSHYFSGILLRDIMFQNAKRDAQLAQFPHNWFSADRRVLFKGASALPKASLKFQQIYVFVVAWDTAKQHVYAQNQTSHMLNAPSWPWHDPFSGCTDGFAPSPTGHCFTAQPALRCDGLGESLEMLWFSLREGLQIS